MRGHTRWRRACRAACHGKVPLDERDNNIDKRSLRSHKLWQKLTQPIFAVCYWLVRCHCQRQ